MALQASRRQDTVIEVHSREMVCGICDYYRIPRNQVMDSLQKDNGYWTLNAQTLEKLVEDTIPF